MAKKERKEKKEKKEYECMGCSFATNSWSAMVAHAWDVHGQRL